MTMKTPRLDKAIAPLDRKARFWGALQREVVVEPLPGLSAADMPARPYCQRHKDSDGSYWHLHGSLLTAVLMDILEHSPKGLDERTLSNRSRVILQARLGLTDAFVNCPMPGSE